MTVLVVEDEDQVRELMVRALQKAGCVVIAAASGPEALSAVDPGSRMDLVVADVVMPDGHGPEIVRLLRRTRPRLRALYVSGYAAQFEASGTASPDVEPHFLQKPFTLTEFIEEVRNVLDAPEGDDDRAWAPETLPLPD